MTAELSRRDFLMTSFTGLALFVVLPGAPSGAAEATAFEPSTWLTITPDGAITVHVTKAEMGQGVGTALAQIVAEELEADWQHIAIDYPSNDPKYGVMATGGSTSVYQLFDTLSRAGAAARIMLIETAARRWNVTPADCVAERSVVRHLPSGQSLSYGELVSKGAITKALSPTELKAITLKKPSQYKIIGHWIPRLDIPDKISGRAKFGIDAFLPGMAYAKVAVPPTRAGARATAVDDSAARRVKGHIKTIVGPELVAVVAATYESAVEARDALNITWDPGPHARFNSTSVLRDYEEKVRREVGNVWVNVGDVSAALAGAARTHQATYTNDFAAQAQIEPGSCLARYQDGVYDIFTGTQVPTQVARDLSQALQVDPAKIRVHRYYLGGAFGRRLDTDIELEAARIAREAGRPVKLVRSREEDFGRGFPRPPTLQVMQAGLDVTGRIVAWEHAIVASAAPRMRSGNLDSQGRDVRGVRGANHAYAIPNRIVRSIRPDDAVPAGFYRSVATGYTLFAIETFLDELAHLAKVDPLTMRLGMLGNNPRLANVLRLAATRSGWGTPLPPGVGRGLACGTEPEPQWRSYIAGVVQARVEADSGQVTVEKITCAVDCGIVVNPDGVRAQIEGALLFGLSSALKEVGTVTNGAFDQKNFDDYQVLRMDEVPEVEIHVVESTEYPTGAGEPGVWTVAPALSNAIFAATGARLRNVPFLRERVRRALTTKG